MVEEASVSEEKSSIIKDTISVLKFGVKDGYNFTKNRFLNWGRAWSLWSVHLCTGCCSPEFMAVSCSRFDAERFGTLPFPSVRQCDLLIILGVVTEKMAKRVKVVYDQMPDPKYVIAMGNCAISGGLFWDSPTVVQGVDKVIPVDVYVPGCPPRPEAFIQGLMMLQKKIKGQ